jgi:hypothetical protein
MKKWEQKMNQQRELRKRGSEVLYERVHLLVEVYNDIRFREWCEECKVVDLDYLDEEVSDVATNFLTLKAVLDTYPDVESWKKHNIRDLLAEALSASKSDRKEREKISWKERCLAAERECERLRAELELTQKILEKTQFAHA